MTNKAGGGDLSPLPDFWGFSGIETFEANTEFAWRRWDEAVRAMDQDCWADTEASDP